MFEDLQPAGAPLAEERGEGPEPLDPPQGSGGGEVDEPERFVKRRRGGIHLNEPKELVGERHPERPGHLAVERGQTLGNDDGDLRGMDTRLQRPQRLGEYETGLVDRVVEEEVPGGELAFGQCLDPGQPRDGAGKGEQDPDPIRGKSFQEPELERGDLPESVEGEEGELRVMALLEGADRLEAAVVQVLDAKLPEALLVLPVDGLELLGEVVERLDIFGSEAVPLQLPDRPGEEPGAPRCALGEEARHRHQPVGAVKGFGQAARRRQDLGVDGLEVADLDAKDRPRLQRQPAGQVAPGREEGGDHPGVPLPGGLDRRFQNRAGLPRARGSDKDVHSSPLHHKCRGGRLPGHATRRGAGVVGPSTRRRGSRFSQRQEGFRLCRTPSSESRHSGGSCSRWSRSLSSGPRYQSTSPFWKMLTSGAQPGTPTVARGRRGMA